MDRTEMVRLSDIFCSNSYGNSPWVDRRSVGRRTVGLDWSSVCGKSPFGVSCFVELDHN